MTKNVNFSKLPYLLLFRPPFICFWRPWGLWPFYFFLQQSFAETLRIAVRPRACWAAPGQAWTRAMCVWATNTPNRMKWFLGQFLGPFTKGLPPRGSKKIVCWFFGTSCPRRPWLKWRLAGNVRVAGCQKSSKRTSKSPYVVAPIVHYGRDNCPTKPTKSLLVYLWSKH